MVQAVKRRTSCHLAMAILLVCVVARDFIMAAGKREEGQ